MAPVDLVGAVVEVIVAERLEASKHLVDLSLLGDEGGKRLLLLLGDLALNPGLIFGTSSTDLTGT